MRQRDDVEDWIAVNGGHTKTRWAAVGTTGRPLSTIALMSSAVYGGVKCQVPLSYEEYKAMLCVYPSRDVERVYTRFGAPATTMHDRSTQTIALNDQQNAVSILQRRMSAAVALIKALGGGWSVASLPAVAPDGTSRK